MKPGNFPSIPIIEAGSHRVVGSFCSTMDAVSADELAALAQLRELARQAKEIKALLRNTREAEEKILLENRLEGLRNQAIPWQEKRRQATHEKNVRLGHATLPIDDPHPHQTNS
ncbi:MAG: hypothetical protein HW380_1850 [Magnetococcales bacterium]|nr:hypothetical protein [Magnetococcales bacterium]HIJ85407.1 hypothetical protein [Magnetococcales bacterium]